MKFLIIHGNNSLSHGIKSLAIQSRLLLKGHECKLAVSPEREEFFKKLSADYTLLEDIQENDGSSYPTMNWFRYQQKINDCIEKEMMLIQEYKPDRVLGIFRFTAKASSFLCDLPFDSLTCGCMLPDTHNALGFYDNIDDLEEQRNFINMFFRSAAIKMNRVLDDFKLEPVRDIREMLLGDRTFLWDIPEFMSVPERENIFHIGPIFWNKWMHDTVDIDPIIKVSKPLAILAFGTCNSNVNLLNRMINVLIDLGYNVVVAAGGQEELASILKDDSRVNSYLFAPIEKILPYTSLIVCHGGQMTIFEALTHEVPVVVIPFHPEQANNGICLERIGCGRMLVPACRFVGNQSVYTDILDEMDDEIIKNMISEFVENPETKLNLKKVKNVLSQYNGLETITDRLEQ